MSEDASLDEFLGDEGDENSRPDEESTESDGTGTDDATATADDDPEPTGEGPDDGPTPATTTYAWSPDGAPCEECGAAVERRWQQDGALVCPACKEWDRA